MNNKENDVAKISIELSRKMKDILVVFLENNKRFSPQEIFTINSSCMGSLIAQVTYQLFKKNTDIELKLSYIDAICDASKIQLRNFENILKQGGIN